MIPDQKTVNTTSAEKWICPNCSNSNEGNFCMECGIKKPVKEEWICPNCQTINKMKFCSECGTKRS